MAHPRRPHRSQRTLPSFVMALAMHAALFGALSLVVHWRTESEAPAVAELWGAVPPPPIEVAPPPPPPPPKIEPEQREADIALKIEKKPPPQIEPPKPEPKPEPPKKVEAKKPEPLKVDQKKIDERKKAEEQKRLDAQRDAVRKSEQERMLAQAGAAGGSSAAGVAGGTGRRDADYAALLNACIRPHLTFVVPEGTSPQIVAQFQIEVLPTGEQAGVRLVKPSGLPGYDAAAERAIRRCDPIPRKRDGTIDRTIVFDMKPVESKQ